MKDDCAICMTAVEADAGSVEGMSEQVQQLHRLLRPKGNQYMRTPCGHKFHVPCLLNWMAIKMECPSCRSQLPSLE